jgi:predicted DNA-binding transcriptional regulator AlpA
MKNSNQPPSLATAEQLAAAFQMTLTQIWRLQRLGRIPVVRLGRRTLRFNVAEVAEALAAQTKPSTYQRSATNLFPQPATKGPRK